jgi:hypothetical protein
MDMKSHILICLLIYMSMGREEYDSQSFEEINSNDIKLYHFYIWALHCYAILLTMN